MIFLIGIEEYHDNIRKILHKDTISEAIDELEKLEEDSKALICLMAFRMEENEDGKITGEIAVEELENFLGFANSKAGKDFFNKDITFEEIEILERLKRMGKYKQRKNIKKRSN
jgi:hypothetical protein